MTQMAVLWPSTVLTVLSTVTECATRPANSTMAASAPTRPRGYPGRWHQDQDAWFRASSAATQEIMAHLTRAA